MQVSQYNGYILPRWRGFTPVVGAVIIESTIAKFIVFIGDMLITRIVTTADPLGRKSAAFTVTALS